MHLEGEQAFDAPVATVWDVSFQAEVLETCIPGAQSVERLSETEFSAEVRRGMASISVTMDLLFEVVEDDRPSGVVVTMEGSDNRTNSTAAGDISIESGVVDDGESSVLNYAADIEFTGRLASLGSRLIKRQIDKDLSTFFDGLQEEIESEAVVSE
ncbi:CoxG family protein [Haloferax sp. DFSO52]|uniref:CoxG family protein n=1 Tax=Haloferax sp. DFSO52 TaxID=3388505 RepID=UPI003A846ECD